MLAMNAHLKFTGLQTKGTHPPGTVDLVTDMCLVSKGNDIGSFLVAQILLPLPCLLNLLKVWDPEEFVWQLGMYWPLFQAGQALALTGDFNILHF